MKTRDKLARLGLVGASLYVGACVVLYLRQGKLIYMGDRKARGDLPPHFTRWEDEGEFLGYKREREQPDALVFMHGSAYSAREWTRATEHFPGDTYVVEYPGYGEKQGTPSALSVRQAGLRGFDAVPPHLGITL